MALDSDLILVLLSILPPLLIPSLSLTPPPSISLPPILSLTPPPFFLPPHLSLSLSLSSQSLEVSPSVQSGMDLLNKVLRLCPGMVCAYIELARCYIAQGMYDEGSRTLLQCLSLEVIGI